MVRICRDVLADLHEAEDASQATFIVLACKAGSIRKRDSIASWLFGVASRVAAQAKAKGARRRRHEALSPSWPPLSPSGMTGASIGSSSTKRSIAYRSVCAGLVLCYWEGHSQLEAAAQLGCPVRHASESSCTRSGAFARASPVRGLSPSLGVWEPSIVGGRTSLTVPAAWME